MFYSVAKFFVKIYIYFLFRIEVTGIENIPKKGAFVLCGNHISNYDPVTVGICCPRTIHFLAKKELYQKKSFAKLLSYLKTIPVDRNTTDMQAFKTAIKLLHTGEVIGIFAEGTRVKEGEETKAKNGVALFALMGEVPVVPVAISGKYKCRQKLYIDFGKPLSFEKYQGKKVKTPEMNEITELIMNEIQVLKTRRI